MRTETPVTLNLKDYTPPAWWVEAVDLHVAIHDSHAEVRSRLACTRNPAVAGGALMLNGEALELISITLDGALLDSARYAYADDLLTITGPLPDAFVLETVVRIDPDQQHPALRPVPLQGRLFHPMRGGGLPPHHLLSGPAGRNGEVHLHGGGRPRAFSASAVQRQSR
jgi:hypothetical protein